MKTSQQLSNVLHCWDSSVSLLWSQDADTSPDNIIVLHNIILTWPELVWLCDPILWTLSSRFTLSSVGMLPLDLMLLMVPWPMVLWLRCSFSRDPSTSRSRSRFSIEEPEGRPWQCFLLTKVSKKSCWPRVWKGKIICLPIQLSADGKYFAFH